MQLGTDNVFHRETKVISRIKRGSWLIDSIESLSAHKMH